MLQSFGLKKPLPTKVFATAEWVCKEEKLLAGTGILQWRV